MSKDSPEQLPLQQKTEKLPLKSIQHQEPNIKDAKQRPRPAQMGVDKVKKKRKLLSFEEDMDEPTEKVKISKAENKIKSNNPNLTLMGNKKEIQSQLKQEFIRKTQQLDEQLFEFDYSYWDGPGVVKKLKRRKKEKVEDLIEICRLQLIANFQNLASLEVRDLLMVVKDFIMPYKMSISQMEALQLKTSKNDNLFNFKKVKIKDLCLSVNMETPIRIVERERYQKNIHSYPFNTWHTMAFE